MEQKEYIRILEWSLMMAWEDLGYEASDPANCPGNTINPSAEVIIDFLKQLEENIPKHFNKEYQKKMFEKFKKYVLDNHTELDNGQYKGE